MKKEQLIYRDKELAKYYDLIYEGKGKNYQEEADKLINIIKQYKKTDGNDLLEIACGTGHHITFFQGDFNCTGIDVNPGILALAKKKHPNVKFKQANMINFDLKKKFD